MTNTAKKPKHVVCVSRFGRIFFVVGFIVASTATPLFSLLVGGILSLIGESYSDESNVEPAAYVVLGGGLTDTVIDGESTIALNTYSKHRTKATWQAWQNHPLPIIVSGVESPWIKDELIRLAKSDKVPVILTENASMNTCENARFSAKLISHETAQGNLTKTHHLYLVSDWYHMARARRQFSKVGLATTPIIAPMPTKRAWTDIPSNLNHSRRAFYESVALLRDMIRPQPNCRDTNGIDIHTLKTPRREIKMF